MIFWSGEGGGGGNDGKTNINPDFFHEKNYNIFDVISLIVLLNSLMEDNFYFTRFISFIICTFY